MTTTTYETTAPATRPTLGRRLTALLEQARARRADRSDLSSQIAAYPATRSVAMVVVPVDAR
jgi:hypothetical protein